MRLRLLHRSARVESGYFMTPPPSHESDDARIAARALDLLRADAFPFTEPVDRLAEMLAPALRTNGGGGHDSPNTQDNGSHVPTREHVGMDYTSPGPRYEARVINLDDPDATSSIVDPETAMAILDDLQAKYPQCRFEVQRRQVFIERWEHYA